MIGTILKITTPLQAKGREMDGELWTDAAVERAPRSSESTRVNHTTKMGRIAASAFMSLRTTIPFSANYNGTPSKKIGLALHSPLVLVPSAVSSQPAIPIIAMSASTTSDDIEVDIASNIASVRQRIDDAVSANDRPTGSVRLVAVSKTKPLEFLQVAYEVSTTYWGNVCT